MRSWPALSHFLGWKGNTMKRLLGLLVAILLAGPAMGCGGETGKNINKDKDKPKPAENAAS
jgi:hypothetical protein